MEKIKILYLRISRAVEEIIYTSDRIEYAKAVQFKRFYGKWAFLAYLQKILSVVLFAVIIYGLTVYIETTHTYKEQVVALYQLIVSLLLVLVIVLKLTLLILTKYECNKYYSIDYNEERLVDNKMFTMTTPGRKLMVEALTDKIATLEYVWEECGYDGKNTSSQDFEHMQELTNKKQFIKSYVDYLNGE